MSNFREVKLGDISKGGKGSYGIAASAKKAGASKYTYLRITDIADDGELKLDGLVSLDDANASKYLLAPGDIVFARTGASTGRAYFYDGIVQDMVYAGFLIKFSLDESKINPRYVKYYCISKRYKDWVTASLTGSTRGNINEQQLREMPIPIPDRATQDRIVRMHDSIAAVIRSNNRTNDNLYQIGVGLYKEMEKSNKAEMRQLGSFFPVLTGKKDANAASENGEFPFFTCSKQVSHIDTYSFDGPAILLAGNGDFNVKFYRGKFDAYQRTYVLMPTNESLLGYLYFAISYNLKNITSNFRGSVIKFITKGNIENFKIPFVDDPILHAQFMSCLKGIEANHIENSRLTHLRNTLLPELMNGKIDLSKVEI